MCKNAPSGKCGCEERANLELELTDIALIVNLVLLQQLLYIADILLVLLVVLVAVRLELAQHLLFRNQVTTGHYFHRLVQNGDRFEYALLAASFELLDFLAVVENQRFGRRVVHFEFGGSFFYGFFLNEHR